MSDLTKKTLHKIQSDHIRPRPRWKFIARSLLMWGVVVAAVCLSTVALALVWYFIEELDWDIYPYIDDGLLEFLLVVLPHFWIVALLIFLVGAIISWRETKFGYRRSIWIIIVIVLLVSASSAWAMRSFHIEQALNDIFLKHVPQYDLVILRKEEMWMQPAKGLIGGEIVGVSMNGFSLEDFNNERWIILVDDRTVIRPSVAIQIGEQVKVIALPLENMEMYAREIRPWDIMGRGRGVKQGEQGADADNQRNIPGGSSGKDASGGQRGR